MPGLSGLSGLGRSCSAAAMVGNQLRQKRFVQTRPRSRVLKSWDLDFRQPSGKATPTLSFASLISGGGDLGTFHSSGASGAVFMVFMCYEMPYLAGWSARGQRSSRVTPVHS